MGPFMKIADELDIYAEAILDQKMCSELCPCYDQCENDAEQQDCFGGRNIYETMDTTQLAYYGRKPANNTGEIDDLVPLVWSSNKSESFSSFTDCLDHW